MVHLRWHCYGPCKDCPGHWSPTRPDGAMVFGGWICKCKCHQPKERIKRFVVGPLTPMQKKLLRAIKKATK